MGVAVPSDVAPEESDSDDEDVSVPDPCCGVVLQSADRLAAKERWALDCMDLLSCSFQNLHTNHSGSRACFEAEGGSPSPSSKQKAIGGPPSTGSKHRSGCEAAQLFPEEGQPEPNTM